ncbi:hypothetical protein LTR17_005597 [Elasticomyces elasticus]|nr:hypothetical protein LTR17_005597 [Elasticomyces elasticus]
MAVLVDSRSAKGSELIITGATIEVVVGPEKSIFYVHEKLLRARSAFFEAALNKEWKEGQDKKVELPEDDASTFGRYIHYLYSGKLAVTQEGTTGNDLLAWLYVLGEKLIDPAFQDRVIDAIIAGTREGVADDKGVFQRWYPVTEVVDTIYKATPKDSPARRLMVDMHVLKGKATWIETEQPECNNLEFLVDLAVAMFEKRVVSEQARPEHKLLDSGVPCAYHKHGKNEKCSGKDL